MERIIDEKLGTLKDKLLLLGGTTEKALQNAMLALTERNSELAKEVLEGDAVIDQMEVDIDRFSVEILALQQPAAHDLRFVISVAKITPILERIADHAASIAEAAILLNDEVETRKYVDLPAMAQTAGEMLRKALDAFTSEDSQASREIIEQDKVIDKYYHKVFDELITGMVENPSSTANSARLLFVAKHLERIGDYVKDICELNVYLTEAAFIKHGEPA